MKRSFKTLLVLALLPLACDGAQDIREAAQAASAYASEDQAANQLYLDDVIDSAAEETESEGDVDASVSDDIREERLTQMASKLMTELDADASGTLSLEEFLVGPEKRTEEQEVDEERKAAILAKMTEDFNSYAGDDAELSADELKTLLKEVAPRVGSHRHGRFPGGQKERVQKTWDEIVAEFDSDGDGLLSQTEYEAMQSQLKAEHDAFREEHGGGRRPGPGGRGP